MIGQVAAKIAFKTVASAGGALYGAASSISKTGKALGMAGQALGSAAQNDSKQTQSSTNNSIIANTGMAGTAGKQKVTGTGTLPAAKAIAKPQVSTKMPTEALLDTAVKYLSSIDKSLKSQLEFERRSYQEEARAEREAIIENKPVTTFSDIKDRLSGFKSDVKDNINIAGTVLKVAAILGGTAALIASGLDQKQVDALKQNVEQFKKTFGWLGDLNAMIPAGGIVGFLFGGKGIKGRLRGGMIGILTSLVAERIFNNMNGQDGESVEGGKSGSSFNGITAGVLAYGGVIAGKNIAKRMSEIKQTGKTAGQLTRAAGASSIAGMQAATRKGNSWLATRRGRKFLVIVARKLGKGAFATVGKYLARIVAGLLVAATGIGAIPGIIAIIANLTFIGWGIFEIASMIWDAWNESKAEDTAAQAVAVKPEVTATKVAGTAVGSNAQQGSNQSILETIRMKESGNDYSAQNPVSTASGAYQFIDGTWQALTSKYGIGTEYSKAKYAPPEIQDAVADKYVSEILKQANGDISKVPVAWYTGNVNGSSSAASPAQVAAYQADWLRVYNGGKPDVSAASGSSSGSMAGSGMQAMASMLGSIGSSIIKPGVARDFAPSSSNVSDRISNESMKLQNDITFGVKKEKTKDTISSPSLSAGTPRGISPQKSISGIDPNYQNINILTKYLAHFRLAA